MRLLRDQKIKGVHNCKLKELDRRCAELELEIEFVRGGRARRELLTSSSVDHAGCDDNKSCLNDAAILQDQTQDALSRTINLVEASKEVGNSTINEHTILLCRSYLQSE